MQRLSLASGALDMRRAVYQTYMPSLHNRMEGCPTLPKGIRNIKAAYDPIVPIFSLKNCILTATPSGTPPT